MEQAGRATWSAKPRGVAASESGDERVQSSIISQSAPAHGHTLRCLKAWPHAPHFVAALRST
jgi:hypothetical protein